jgi:pimeloyl-ACP methyl ester carboxylesterase
MTHFEPPEGARLHRLREIELYAIDEGPDSPIGTAVLVHGIGGSIDDWDALRVQLRERFRVVTVERPGNGWSSSFPDPPDDYLAANSEALRELLSEMRVREPILVGWSYGGAVVLRLATEEPDYPKGVLHLCGIAPGYRPPGGLSRLRRAEWLLNVPFLPQIIDRAFLPNVIALLPRSRWMDVQYGPEWRHLSERTLSRTLLGMQRSKLIVAKEALAVEADLQRLRPNLSELHVRTLIVAGELDAVIPTSVSAELETLLPNSRRMLIQNGRHAFHILHPERVATLILDFSIELGL